MSDGGASNLEAAIWAIGSLGVIAAYGIVHFYLRQYQEARDERVRGKAYRQGRDDERAARHKRPKD